MKSRVVFVRECKTDTTTPVSTLVNAERAMDFARSCAQHTLCGVMSNAGGGLATTYAASSTSALDIAARTY